MSTTFTLLPPGTYAAGLHSISAATVPTGTTGGSIDLDTSNYDSTPCTITFYKVELSQDNGVTWKQVAGGALTGTNAIDKTTGLPIHTTSLGIDLPGPAPADGSWKIRASVTIGTGGYTTLANGTLTLLP